MTSPVFIKRVTLRNYKSIRACSIELGPLTFLVGPNGAGKSNFLDALAFIKDCLRTDIQQAVNIRGGIRNVMRRGTSSIEVSIDIEISGTHEEAVPFPATYRFKLVPKPRDGYFVKEEECTANVTGGLPKHFIINTGSVTSTTLRNAPPVPRDQFFLGVAAGYNYFDDIYTGLRAIQLYHLDPLRIKRPQPPDEGLLLDSDGRNVGSVLRAMAESDPASRVRVLEFMQAILPNLTGIDVRISGGYVHLDLEQKVASREGAWRFPSSAASDGTLRALAVLVALFQRFNGERNTVPLVMIEEPELAIHPGAAAVIRDALYSASAIKQIIVSTHSPDVLDDKDVDCRTVLAVQSDNGETMIGHVNQATCEAVKRRLFTVGELLRLNQIEPEQLSGAVPKSRHALSKGIK